MRLLLLLGLSMLAGCATASSDIYAAPKGDGGALSKDTGAEEEDSSTPPTDTGASITTDTGSSTDTAAPSDTGSSTDAGSCASGMTKCGSSCVDTKTDTSNCGACGNACTSGDLCTIGVCTSPCSGGKTKCGSSCVDTSTDTSNCGACGTVCATGETCSAGSCLKPGTTVTFPSTTSTVKSGTLGAGGGGAYYQSGDYVTQSFPRTTAATKLTVNFKMSDHTSNYCTVGTLNWNVMVNGTVVGTYSWLGGTTSWSSGALGPDQTIAKTFTFASIAPVSGNFTLRYQATNTVCSGAGSWNWYPGGTATLE